MAVVSRGSGGPGWDLGCGVASLAAAGPGPFCSLANTVIGTSGCALRCRRADAVRRPPELLTLLTDRDAQVAPAEEMEVARV